MHGFSRLVFLALGVCLLLASWMGCANSGQGHGSFHLWGFASSEKPVPGVKTPEQRIAELRAIAKQGPGKNPDEQQRISAELARQIQQEPDPALRKQILKTISIYPTPMASAVLTAGLSDNDFDVRVVCCAAWGSRGGPEAVQQLTRILSSDTNTDVRLAAAKALGQTHSTGAIVPLADALVDGDPAMQHRLIESLKMVSGQDFKGDVNAWREFAKANPNGRPLTVAERIKRFF